MIAGMLRESYFRIKTETELVLYSLYAAAVSFHFLRLLPHFALMGKAAVYPFAQFLLLNRVFSEFVYHGLTWPLDHPEVRPELAEKFRRAAQNVFARGNDATRPPEIRISRFMAAFAGNRFFGGGFIGLSEDWLRRWETEEVEAVIAHEETHLDENHILLRQLFAALAGSAAGAYALLKLDPSLVRVQEPLKDFLLASGPYVAVLNLFLLCGLIRTCEYRADKGAVEKTSAAALENALRRMGADDPVSAPLEEKITAAVNAVYPGADIRAMSYLEWRRVTHALKHGGLKTPDIAAEIRMWHKWLVMREYDHPPLALDIVGERFFRGKIQLRVAQGMAGKETAENYVWLPYRTRADDVLALLSPMHIVDTINLPVWLMTRLFSPHPPDKARYRAIRLFGRIKQNRGMHAAPGG
jgi:Zn-dependent protease with chaperone function